MNSFTLSYVPFSCLTSERNELIIGPLIQQGHIKGKLLFFSLVLLCKGIYTYILANSWPRFIQKRFYTRGTLTSIRNMKQPFIVIVSDPWSKKRVNYFSWTEGKRVGKDIIHWSAQNFEPFVDLLLNIFYFYCIGIRLQI